jgi:hypothetical protein
MAGKVIYEGKPTKESPFRIVVNGIEYLVMVKEGGKENITHYDIRRSLTQDETVAVTMFMNDLMEAKLK